MSTNAPDEIHNVSHGILSVARYFGGAKFNGHSYVYDPTRDVLIRADVLKARKAAERKAKREAKAKSKGGDD